MLTTGENTGRQAHHGYEIIDSHTHIYPDKIAARAAEGIGEFYELPTHHNGSIGGLLEAGARHGVSGFLVCSVATSPQQVASINTFIGGQCNEHREFYGFGAMHPLVENPAEEVERMCALGLRGIKLHPDIQKFNIDSEEAYRIYEAAQGVLPILFHTGDKRYDFSHPRRLKKVLDDFPRLAVIAAHLGAYSIWENSDELTGHERVWFDTSSALEFMPAEKALRRVCALGVERCFFGTDYPLGDCGRALALFFDLNLSDADRQKILARNFKQFLADFSPARNS